MRAAPGRAAALSEAVPVLEQEQAQLPAGPRPTGRAAPERAAALPEEVPVLEQEQEPPPAAVGPQPAARVAPGRAAALREPVQVLVLVQEPASEQPVAVPALREPIQVPVLQQEPVLEQETVRALALPRPLGHPPRVLQLRLLDLSVLRPAQPPLAQLQSPPQQQSTPRALR